MFRIITWDWVMVSFGTKVIAYVLILTVLVRIVEMLIEPKI